MSEPQRIAILRVSAELLRDALHLPPETTVLDARSVFEYGGCVIQLRVEHPDLDPVPPGHLLPFVDAVLRKEENGEIAFVEWVK